MSMKKPLYANLKDIPPPEKSEHAYVTPNLRPEILQGNTFRINTGCGNLYITINEDGDGRPFELFTKMGKSGACSASQCEALGRAASLLLRCTVDPEAIIKQFIGITCNQPVWEKGERVLSCSDAIAKVLKNYLARKRSFPIQDATSKKPPKLISLQ